MAEAVSALSGRRATGYVTVEDTGLRGQVTLKGDLAASDLAHAVREITGAAVPGPWQMSGDGERAAVWMALDELLLLVPHGDAGSAVHRATEALSGTHHLAVDVSDARAILRLSGPLSGEVLAKGAPCDLSDRAFPPGTARRTHLGGLAVAIWRLDANRWEVAAFRSNAGHLMSWLEDAARPGAEVGYGAAPGAR